MLILVSLEPSCDQIESMAQVSSQPWSRLAQGTAEFTQDQLPICELGLGSTSLVKVKNGKSSHSGDAVKLDSNIQPMTPHDKVGLKYSDLTNLFSLAPGLSSLPLPNTHTHLHTLTLQTLTSYFAFIFNPTSCHKLYLDSPSLCSLCQITYSLS